MNIRRNLSTSFSLFALAVALASGCNVAIPSGFFSASSKLASPSMESVSETTPSPTPTPSTTKRFERSSNLVRDYTYSSPIKAWESADLDILTGQEGTSADFGHLTFEVTDGFNNAAYNGFFIAERQYSNVAADVILGAIDKGEVGIDSITEAPEYGYSSGVDGQRNFVRLVSGHLYIFRIKAKGGAETYYVKLFIKDIQPTSISYILVTQTQQGVRQF